MKVIDFNNKTHNWPPIGYTTKANDTRPRSKYHIRARELIKQLFPLDMVLEEVPIPSSLLKFDFVLPNRRLCLEIQGEQHYTYNSFFFASKSEWMAAQRNDRLKEEWCQNNNIRLVLLPYDKDNDEWEKLIRQR